MALDDRTNTSQSRTGTGFTNLQRILDANQDSRVGEAVQGGVRNQAQDTRNQAANETVQFQDEANKNRLDTQQNVQDRQTAINTAATGAAPTDTQTQQFQTFREGQYKGPTDLKDSSTLQSQATDVQNTGKQAQDQTGRFGLLQKYVSGSPRYSLGEQNLDSTILGQKPQDLRAIKQETVGVTRDVNQQVNNAQNLGKEYQNRAQGFAQDTNKMIAGQTAPITQAINSQVDKAKAADTTRQTNAQNIVNTLTMKPDPSTGQAPKSKDEALKSAVDMGKKQGLITDQDEARLAQLDARAKVLGLNLSDIMANKMSNTDAQGVTSAGLTTADQAAKLNALAKLGGTAGVGQYGEYQAGKSAFDLDGIDRAIAQAEASRAGVPLGDYTPSQTGVRPDYLTQGLSGTIGLHAVGSVLGDQSVGGQLINTATGVMEAPVNLVRSVFGGCFADSVYVLMQDNSKKSAKDIKLGDMVKYGGLVIGHGSIYSNKIYNYNDLLIAEGHLVFEDNSWVRIENSKVAQLLENPPTEIVYPIVTENHLLVANGMLFGDYAETDQGTSVNDEARLNFVNSAENIEKCKLLALELKNENPTL